MAKSKAEVLASLRSIFNGEAETEKTPKSAKPAPTKSEPAAFGKFRKASQPVAVVEEEEEEEEFEEDEDTEEEESEVCDSDGTDDTEEESSEDEAEDVEVAPVEELLDRVESLIDYISENGEALKAWIAACR